MSQDGNLETVTALYFFKWNKYYIYTVQKMACSQVENNSIMIEEILNTSKTWTNYQVVNFCPPFCLTSVFEDLLMKLPAFTVSFSRCVGFPWTLGKHQVCCLGLLPF